MLLLSHAIKKFVRVIYALQTPGQTYIPAATWLYNTFSYRAAEQGALFVLPFLNRLNFLQLLAPFYLTFNS